MKSNRNKAGLLALLGLTLGFLITGASAASLQFAPSSASVASGDVLNLTIQGAGFTSLTNGGDFSVTWNPAALQYVGLTVVAANFDTSAKTETSVVTGTLDRVDVLRQSSGALGPNFEIAQLTFNVLSGLVGTTSVQLGASTLFPVGWYDPDVNTQYPLTYGAAALSAVPAPSAVWLLATGMTYLTTIGLRKRRRG